MEENNNIQDQNIVQSEHNKHICFENHCWKKCLAMVVASFLGGFLAIYFVADQTFQRRSYHHFGSRNFEQRIFDDMERMYKQDMKAFDEMFKMPRHHKKHKIRHNDFGMPFFMTDTVKIKTEFDDNKFNVFVCLKPFNGDENKINYVAQGRKLTVFGKSEVKDKDFVQDIEFSQDFILPENADTSKISKIKDGDKLVISIPIKE